MDVRKLFPVLVLGGVGLSAGCSNAANPTGSGTGDSGAAGHDSGTSDDGTAADTTAADADATDSAAALPEIDPVVDFGTTSGDGAHHW